MINTSLESYYNSLNFFRMKGKLMTKQIIRTPFNWSKQYAAAVLLYCRQMGTQISDLEEAVHLSPGYLSRIVKEAVARRLSLDKAVEIANYLDEEIDQLLFFKPKEG